MPTPNERKALLFIAGVALLGGAVRLHAALGDAKRPVPAEELAALERQLGAAESAAAARGKKGSGTARGRRSQGRAVVSPARDAAPSPPTFPPALARRGAAPVPRGEVAIVVDLDRATAEQIAALPGIGPSLARRIVQWRDSAGGLGGLEGLDCVSGVGPALLERVRPHVTFSGTRRPSCASPRPARERRRAAAP